ncbi:MAG TPA: HlyD family secretion protein, partial [Candidatus Binataceae bacterium]
MNDIIEDNDENQFANGQSSRDLRVSSDATELETQLDVGDLRERTESSDRLKALRKNSGEDLNRRIELPDGAEREYGTSGGSPWFRRITKRVLLVVLLVLALGAVSPFAWNYLQSYESTDDAQIDGHIDPLSSRIDGTVIRVHPEDDDRVRKGELLVEIDPRDYEVAVAQAGARLELAIAQVASAKQDYAAALANVREDDAANFRAQRDAQRFAVLLDRQVVAQNEYDQYIAAARVDAAKVDSAREAAGSALKTIVAREADVDAARAALDQALLNLSYTKIYAPANGIVGKRSVELGSRIEPGQTLMFVTETDEIWVTADFKETQLARMHRGEKVTIHVDTFGRNYQG